MLLVIYQNKIQQRAERNNFPLHNHRVTKLSRVASFNATLELLFLKTGILTIYTVLLNNKVVKRPIKWKIAKLFIPKVINEKQKPPGGYGLTQFKKSISIAVLFLSICGLQYLKSEFSVSQNGVNT